MGDADGVSTTSLAPGVDPVFAEVAALVFGDGVDPREVYDIAKKAGRSSDEEKRRQRKQAQIGLASNVLGLTAGGVGTITALRDERLGAKGAPGWAKTMHRAGKKIPAPLGRLSIKNPKAGAALAAGGLGLQTANIGGDVVANRVLSREANKKSAVAKAWAAGMQEILGARACGVLTTQQAMDHAVELAKRLEAESVEISKWTPPSIVRGARRIMTEPLLFAQAPTARAQRTRQAMRRTFNPVAGSRHRRDVRAAVVADSKAGRQKLTNLALGGGLAAGGGAGYLYGTRRQEVRRPQLPEAWRHQTVTKSEDLVDYAFSGEVSKLDEDKRLAFGWCSLSEVDGQPVVDLQNDWIPIEEIEKSAYAYVLSSRKGGDMHAREGDGPRHTADLVESMIVTPEKLRHMGLKEEVIKSVPTGWWVGFRVKDDAQWQAVKNGERTGFSVHGAGKRVSKLLTDAPGGR